MNKKDLSAYLAKIGRKGGQASRRTLTTEQAREMARKSALARKRKAKKVGLI